MTLQILFEPDFYKNFSQVKENSIQQNTNNTNEVELIPRMNMMLVRQIIKLK